MENQDTPISEREKSPERTMEDFGGMEMQPQTPANPSGAEVNDVYSDIPPLEPIVPYSSAKKASISRAAETALSLFEALETHPSTDGLANIAFPEFEQLQSVAEFMLPSTDELADIAFPEFEQPQSVAETMPPSTDELADIAFPEFEQPQSVAETMPPSTFAVANIAFPEFKQPHGVAETVRPSAVGVATGAISQFWPPQSVTETMQPITSDVVHRFLSGERNPFRPRSFSLQSYSPLALQNFIEYCEHWFNEHFPLEGIRATTQLLCDKIFTENQERYCVFIVDACLKPVSSLEAEFGTNPNLLYRTRYRQSLIMAERAWDLYIFDHQRQPVTFNLEYEEPKFAASQLEPDVFARSRSTQKFGGEIVNLPGGIKYHSAFIFYPINSLENMHPLIRQFFGI